MTKKKMKHSYSKLLNIAQIVRVTQSCLTLCNPMDCSLPGSSVHGILQARILEWVTISSPRGSFQQGWKLSLLPLWRCRRVLYCWASEEVQQGQQTTCIFSWRCCNKLPQTEWHGAEGMASITGLEATCSKSRCHHGQFLLEAWGRICSNPLS